METIKRFNQRKVRGIPFRDSPLKESNVGNLKLFASLARFRGRKANNMSRGTDPISSNFLIARVKTETAKGVKRAPIRLPINAAKMIILKFPHNIPTEFFRIEVSTIPPRRGACSILDILEIKSEAFTKERESASCLVLTPVSRIEEAMVSVKCINAVKMQTTISGFIEEYYIPDRSSRKALILDE
jgi:hypothetical protein